MEETILQQLYNHYGKDRISAWCPEETRRILARRGNLRRVLSKKQYRQVFRMLDDTENIAGKMSLLNFVSGVQFGMQLMAEVRGDVTHLIDD